MSLRLFVALEPPDEVREALRALGDAMRRAVGPAAREVKWVAPESVHLTLQFLGAVDEARGDEIASAVRAAAARASPAQLALANAGAFPSPRRPRVLWVGLAGDLAPLGALVASLGAALAPLGFPPEERPFRPHLTLGRARDAHGSPRLAPALAVPAVHAGWPAREVVLFRSHLSPRGPRYEALVRAPLGASPGP